MSHSNHESVTSCSKSHTTPEEASELKKVSLTKLIETASRKLDFLQVFGDRTSAPSKPLLGVPSEILTLSCQRPGQNIGFKSLPPLGAKDSLENIIKIRRYGELPRRNALRSFVRANSLEKRPRRRLYQNKAEAAAGNNELDTLKSKINPEVNAKKLRYQLAKERKVYNRFSIGRFGHNIKNRIRGEPLEDRFGSALNQGLSYEKVVSMCDEDDQINLQISSNNTKPLRANCCIDVKSVVPDSELRVTKASKLLIAPNESYSSMEMLRSLEKLNLNPGICEAIVRPKSLETSQETLHDKPLVDLSLNKNDLSTWIEDTSINERVAKTNILKECKDKRGLNFKDLNEIDCKTVNYPRMETSKDNTLTDLQSCPSRVDFSSGDDSRNLTSMLTLDEAQSVCKMTSVEERRDQDYESRRRSVQWNSEVDVIYYAGDTDGGKVVHRKIEPLREEADQQARRNGFIKLVLNKNLLTAFNTYKFRDPWVTVYDKY